MSSNRPNGRAAKRRKISIQDDSDDEFAVDGAMEAAMTEADGKPLADVRCTSF